jgi:putative endonuclease
VWYLYVIRCRDGSLYTGIAMDVARRLAAHRDGKGAKYLRGRGPLALVYKSRIGPKGLALKVERRVKTLPKVRKEDLIAKRISIAALLPGTQ